MEVCLRCHGARCRGFSIQQGINNPQTGLVGGVHTLTLIVLARSALAFDLSHAVWNEGSFAGFPATVNEDLEVQSPVLYSYWNRGTAGIGTALTAHLRCKPDEKLWKFLDPMKEEATRKYTAFPQLFSGGAGLGNFLLDGFELTGDEQYLSRAWHVAEGILLCRLERDEGIVFPGEQARRESADFATGSAGICLFLDRLLKSGEEISPNFNFLPNVFADCSGFHASA